MSTFSFFAFAVLASLSTLGADILPGAMERLPPGSVRPTGWLLKQMEMQRDGLTGRAEELYVDIGKSDWLTGGKRGGQFAWERGPYYAKGLTALAFALDDAELKARAKKWIDAPRLVRGYRGRARRPVHRTLLRIPERGVPARRFVRERIILGGGTRWRRA